MQINLLSQLSPEELRILKKRRLWETASVVCLVGAILVVLAVFGYWTVLDNEFGLVERKIAQAEAEVNRFAGRESLLRGYKDKIEFLTAVVDKRPRLDSLLSEFYLLSPAGIAFSEIAVQEEQVVASGVAVSSLELGDFIDRLKETPILAEKKVTQVTLTSLVKEKEGDYKFSLKVSLG